MNTDKNCFVIGVHLCSSVATLTRSRGHPAAMRPYFMHACGAAILGGEPAFERAFFPDKPARMRARRQEWRPHVSTGLGNSLSRDHERPVTLHIRVSPTI